MSRDLLGEIRRDCNNSNHLEILKKSLCLLRGGVRDPECAIILKNLLHLLSHGAPIESDKGNRAVPNRGEPTAVMSKKQRAGTSVAVILIGCCIQIRKSCLRMIQTARTKSPDICFFSFVSEQ